MYVALFAVFAMLAEPQDVPSAVIVTVSVAVAAVLRVIVPATVPVWSVTDAVVAVAVIVPSVSAVAPVRFGFTDTA